MAMAGLILLVVGGAAPLMLGLCAAGRTSSFRLTMGLLLLALLMAVIAAGVWAAFPRQVVAWTIPHITPSNPHGWEATEDGFTLEVFARRWRETVIRVTPLHAIDRASKVELLWMEAGRLHHAPFANRGWVSTGVFSVPNSWPLVMATVESNPLGTHIAARWVDADGRWDGSQFFYNSNDRMFAQGIDTWGQQFLEEVKDHRGRP